MLTLPADVSVAPGPPLAEEPDELPPEPPAPLTGSMVTVLPDVPLFPAPLFPEPLLPDPLLPEPLDAEPPDVPSRLLMLI